MNQLRWPPELWIQFVISIYFNVEKKHDVLNPSILQ
jgi:hypothetical protein